MSFDLSPALAQPWLPCSSAYFGYAKRFRNEDHICGFCGMFPTRSSSGGIEKPGQRLTKNGSDRVKRALYIVADVARKIDPNLAAVYWRLMVNKGHHHKQAICAVAKRLIHWIYRVLKTGELYVLRDQDGNAITVQEGNVSLLRNSKRRSRFASLAAISLCENRRRASLRSREFR